MKTKKPIIAKLVSCSAVIIFLFAIGLATKANHTTNQAPTESLETEHVIHENIPPEPIKVSLSQEEINLIALVTMAEAEGESELGKRYVIDTILNRVDMNGFPDSVSDVIYQPNAFESLWNGRIERCSLCYDIRDLVIEELISRKNRDVVYFCSTGYSDYGTPLFKEGNHYFSGN